MRTDAHIIDYGPRWQWGNLSPLLSPQIWNDAKTRRRGNNHQGRLPPGIVACVPDWLVPAFLKRFRSASPEGTVLDAQSFRMRWTKHRAEQLHQWMSEQPLTSISDQQFWRPPSVPDRQYFADLTQRIFAMNDVESDQRDVDLVADLMMQRWRLDPLRPWSREERADFLAKNPTRGLRISLHVIGRMDYNIRIVATPARNSATQPWQIAGRRHRLVTAGGRMIRLTDHSATIPVEWSELNKIRHLDQSWGHEMDDYTHAEIASVADWSTVHQAVQLMRISAPNASVYAFDRQMTFLSAFESYAVRHHPEPMWDDQ